MALSMIKSLKDTAGFTKALIEYLSLKNKVLYSGTTEWKTGSKTISGISKYNSIKVYLWNGYNGIELERIGTTFQGDGMVANVSSGSHSDIAMTLNFNNKDLVTIGANSVLHHQSAGNHPKAIDGWVLKIVGVEPIIPDALAEYIRGGYCVRLGGGLRAKFKAMFDGHRQFCKEHKDYGFGKTEQGMEIDRENHKLFKLQIIKLQRIDGGRSIRRCRNNKPYTSSTYKRFSEQVIRLYIRIKLCLCFFDQNGYSSIQAANRIHSNSISLRQIAPRGCCYA